jgi:elongation factor Ts
LGSLIVDKILENGWTEVRPELNDLVSNLQLKIGENMALRRIKLVKAEANEYLTYYIHNEGAIGVTVKLSSDKPAVFNMEEVKEFAHSLALQVAAFNPLVLDQGKLDPKFIKEQEEIFKAQMQNDEDLQNKPANALENILKGKLKKYLKDICLLDQEYVKDDKFTVKQMLDKCSAQIGATLSISDYVYFKVG